MADQTVSWKGHLLKLKAMHTILSDTKFGPGSIKMFRAMGVKLEKVE
jgi:hypothetical protein